MTTIQRIIKYAAMAFAIFLVFTIVSATISLVSLIHGQGGLFQEINYMNIEKQYSDVKSIDLSNSNCKVVIQAGDQDYVTVKAIHVTDAMKIEFDKSEHNLQISDRNDARLIIRWLMFKNTDQTSSITITIPQKTILSSLRIRNGSKECIVTACQAKEARFDNGSGTIKLNDCMLQDTNIETGSGDIDFSGMINGDIDMEVGSGEINGEIYANPGLYHIESDIGSGSITINKVSIKEGEINNKGALYDMSLDVGSGVIKLRFKEPI